MDVDCNLTGLQRPYNHKPVILQFCFVFCDSLGEKKLRKKKKPLSLADLAGPCSFSLCWHLIKNCRNRKSPFSPFWEYMKEGEFPRRMDLQLYPHMINITQGGLCTGSSMSNYGPTVSDWEQTSCQRLPGEELHRHGTQALHVGAGWCHHRPDFMTLSPQLIEQVRLFSMVRPAGNEPSRNTAGIWDSASINANRGEAYSLFYFHVFKATHVYQTHNDTHDLTDDIYSMSTFAVLWRADADSSPSPSLKEFQGLHVLPHLPVRHISQPRHSRGCSPGQP